MVTGSKHDYFSIASYYWPCTAQCNSSIEPFNCSEWCQPQNNFCNYSAEYFAGGTHGQWDGWEGCTLRGDLAVPTHCNLTTGLPWVPHDGYSVYAAEQTAWVRYLDRDTVDDLWEAVVPLTLAWWVTNDAKYLERSAFLFRYFFLSPATAMTPNLDFAQTLPGCHDGTGFQKGWAETVDFARFTYGLSCIQLLEYGDEHAEVWTASDRAGMRTWVSAFLDWWLHSLHGAEARKKSNNEGTAYTNTALAMALYLQNSSLAQEIAMQDGKKHIEVQIAADGRLPQEDDEPGPASFGYHLGDLWLLLIMARGCNMTGAFDAFNWHSPTNASASIRTALDWLAPYCSQSGVKRWPYDKVEAPQICPCMELYRIASLSFDNNKTYEKIAEAAPDGFASVYDFGLGMKAWTHLVYGLPLMNTSSDLKTGD